MSLLIFTTENAKLAAVLALHHKIKPLRITLEGTGVTFIFRQSEQLNEIVKSFRAKNLEISDTKLLNKLTKLLQP